MLLKELSNTTMFVGLFVVVIFFISAGSFLYFRLYTDIEADRIRYHAISKLGLTEAEMKRSNTIQIALLFFVPFFLAVVHSSVALFSLKQSFHTPVLVPALMAMGSFFLIQLVYFLGVRSSYLAKIKKGMV